MILGLMGNYLLCSQAYHTYTSGLLAHLD